MRIPFVVMSFASVVLLACSKPKSREHVVAQAAAESLQTSECEQCSAKKCAYAHQACENTAQVVGSGPKANRPKSELCSEILACVRRTDCAAEQNHFCYCGKGVEIDACLDAAPTGVCKDLISAGAESSDATQIAHRYLDSNYATGLAFELISCEREKCKGPCG